MVAGSISGQPGEDEATGVTVRKLFGVTVGTAVDVIDAMAVGVMLGMAVDVIDAMAVGEAVGFAMQGNVDTLPGLDSIAPGAGHSWDGEQLDLTCQSPSTTATSQQKLQYPAEGGTSSGQSTTGVGVGVKVGFAA